MKKGEKKDLAKLAEARAEVQVRVLYIGLLSPHGKGWGGGVRHKICERERKNIGILTSNVKRHGFMHSVIRM